MSNKFFFPEPDETLSQWLENTFDQLHIVYQNSLYLIKADEVTHLIDNPTAKATHDKVLSLTIKLMSYEFNKAKIIDSQTVTTPVADFLFDTLDFAITMIDFYTNGFEFEDYSLQDRLVEEADILISVIRATSEFSLENNL
jgi:hypothetical protein